MSDEHDDEISPIARVKAGFELNGEPLRAYSPMRVVAARAMGLQWPFIGESAMEQAKTTGFYPSAPKDVAILFWLCSQKDASDLTADEVKAKTWTPSRALQTPVAALDAAIEWAAEKGIFDPTSEGFRKAYDTFYEIVQPIEEAKTVTQGSERVADDTGKV